MVCLHFFLDYLELLRSTKTKNMSVNKKRTFPNILITGTPGTGKTTLCTFLIETRLPQYTYHNVSEIALKNSFIESDDNDRETKVLDEDAVCDYLEEQGIGSFGPKDGGHIVDYHSSDFFAERYFDLIFVLRSSTEVLFERLEKRSYSESKIRENMDCEIFQVCFDEAINSYPEIEVISLNNDTLEELETNCDKIAYCINKYAEY